MRRTLRAAAAMTLFVTLGPPPVAADSGPAAKSFADIVSTSTLIVVASVDIGPDAGVVLEVEGVLKGASARHLIFRPPTMAPELDDGGRAVIAFRDPTTIDFRAPTHAWTIGADGSIDPRGLQRYPDLPPTLDAMLRRFNVPVASPQNQVPDTASPVRDSPVPALVAILAALVAAGLVLLRRPRTAADGVHSASERPNRPH